MLRPVAREIDMAAQEIGRLAHDAEAPREPDGALILGGAHGSLAVARSLGRRGIPVWFATHDHPIAKYSRYVARSFEWAGPSDKGAASSFPQVIGPSAGCCSRAATKRSDSSPGTTRCCNGPIASPRRYGNRRDRM